jgi:hypothetical protein
MKQKIDIQALYVGVQGSGKTYRMMKDVQALVKKYQKKYDLDNGYMRYENPRILAFDPFREWTVENGEQKLLVNGTPIIPLTEQRFQSENPAERYAFLGTPDKDEFLHYIERSQNTIIIVEELLHFDRSDFPVLRRASSARRHNGNVLFSSTQRPSHMPLILISSCTDIFAFKIISKDDTKKLTSFSNYNTENIDLSLFKVGQCVNLIS